MIKELFKPGDVLFYDKMNEGISNLSSEDSETDIYFDSNQYTALGVVVAVDEVSSTLKLITPALYPYLIMKLPNAEDHEMLLNMKDKVKECTKFFTKECGKQKTVKLYIPEESDIDALCENAEDIIKGCEALQYFCQQFLKNYNLPEVISEENLSFVNKKKLNFLLSGVENAVIFKQERESQEIALRNAKDFANIDIRKLDIAFASDASEEDIKNFFNNNGEDKVSAANQISAKSVFNSFPTEIDVNEALLNNFTLKNSMCIKSLKEVKEEFPKAEQMSFWLIPFMMIQID